MGHSGHLTAAMKIAGASWSVAEASRTSPAKVPGEDCGDSGATPGFPENPLWPRALCKNCVFIIRLKKGSFGPVFKGIRRPDSGFHAPHYLEAIRGKQDFCQAL
jgi:hypothetical protein